MKSKSIILAIAFFVAFSSASAVISQKLVLKNGTILEGYIQNQRPGEKIVFMSERSEMLLPGKEVRSINDKEVAYKDLPEAWKKWGDENNAWIGAGDDKKLKLSDIIAQKRDVRNVRVLEKGARVRYISMNVEAYTLTWDTIQTLCADRRDKTLLSGIDRTYQLSSGLEYAGQYIEEEPGKTISVLGEDGVIQVLESDKVAKYTILKVNPNQTLFEQSDLIDIVRTKNGSVDGIIIERNYGSNNYLLIQDQNGNTKSIRFDEVVEYRKEPNKAYAPLTDILLKEGELVINRETPVELDATEDDKSNICVEKKDTVLILPKDKPLTVEYNLGANPTTEFIIMKVGELKAKDKKNPAVYGFTYKEIVESAIKAKEVVTSVNNTSKATYEVAEEGYYVVYDQTKKKAYPFEIK